MKSIIFLSVLILSMTTQDPWIAPPEADKLVNPLASNVDAIKGGKKLFASMCGVCHGTSGKGDGVAGAALNPKPTNLTPVKFQSQSDGAIFWKIAEGRTPMAAYKSVLSEEQRWQLVSYLRTLKKP